MTMKTNPQISPQTILSETLMATGFEGARLSADMLGMTCQLESIEYMFKILLKQKIPMTNFSHTESRYQDEWAIMETLSVSYGK